MGVIKAQTSQFVQDHKYLQACLGYDYVDLGGVKFESLPQTIAWVSANLPSGSYYVFMDLKTLLDALGSFHLSDKDVIDETYHDTRYRFENKSAAKVAAFFERDLPTILWKMDSTTTTTASSPSPSIESYAAFNAHTTHSGVKQRSLNAINNSLAIITSVISYCLAGHPVALMIANTFHLNSKVVINSMLTWMEPFFQDLHTTNQSDASEAWFIVCSCIRGYFKELRKVRSPTQVVSNMISLTDRAGTYLWSMAQSHRITKDFISYRWHEHPSIASVLNYHLFPFMAPLSTHNKLKEEVTILKRPEISRQSEISKLVS